MPFCVCISEDHIEKPTSLINSDLDGELIKNTIETEQSLMESSAYREPERWRNLVRSHVPYVRNGNVLLNMVSKEVYSI